MNIALDWDGTYTRDPDSWQGFIRAFRQAGHKVWIVTARHERTPVNPVPEGIEDVIYCDFEAKKTVTDNLDLDIHVWIDDEPIWINKGAESYPILFPEEDTSDEQCSPSF